MTYGDTKAVENVAAAAANLKTEIIRSVSDHKARDAALALLAACAKAAMDAIDGLKAG